MCLVVLGKDETVILCTKVDIVINVVSRWIVGGVGGTCGSVGGGMGSRYFGRGRSASRTGGSFRGCDP